MTKKLPSDYVDKLMTGVLVRIAQGGQPYSRSNSDGVAMYYLQQWGFVRTRNRSNKWEVTCAGYQHLKSEYPESEHTAKVEKATGALKKLLKRLQHLGKHAIQCEAEIANLVGAVTLLENLVRDIDDKFLEQDRKDSGLV